MLAGSVFAATTDIIDTTAKASLTIYKYDQTAAESAGVTLSSYTADGEKDEAAETALASYALQGVEYTYVKVGSINTDTQAGTVKLLYDIPTALETILGLSDASHKYTSDQLNTALATLLGNNTTGKNSLESYVSSNGGTAMTETDAKGKTSATGLDLGLYLVVETRVPEEVNTTTDPFFVSLPMTDVTGDYWNYDVVVYPKNQTNNPTIDKLVSENGTYADTATASEGDVLNYRIVSKMPTITSKATYLTQYEFKDTMAKGITYKVGTKILFYDNESDAKNGTGTPVATWDTGSANFTSTISSTDNTLTVSVTSDGLAAINPSYSGKYMVVAYSADVASTADVTLGDKGNENAVDLTYKRTNTSYSNTISDKAYVYSYGINLTKTFSDSKGTATDVQFVLKNNTDGYYIKATGSDGVYHVTDSATVFSPSSTGSLVINGLEADTYVLTEIKTSAGYSLLKEPVTIVFTGTVDTITPSKATVTGITNPNEQVIVVNGNRASATVDGNATTMSEANSSTNALVNVSVVNTKDFLLPQTGGLGTLAFTLLGAVAVIAGAAFFSRKSRRA
jgi:LPXTG-motif cell wall-anchored protein